MVVAKHGQAWLLFDCPFDEETEDYVDHYVVYLLPSLSDLDLQGSWAEFPKRAVAGLGTVAVSELPLDATKRMGIDTEFLKDLLQRSGPKGQRIPAAS
jgi:hypothetical protein